MKKSYCWYVDTGDVEKLTEVVGAYLLFHAF